ncbi:zinc-dependent metalloprotease [Sediminibacterium roseum]|uniref:Zinc-dependent metalloprotease n=1 Tax=Sediminibacterium roseum TaxID=1978412 RepID=A0ABW9ZZI3_9BACT|nr:zinc-dependent metalloprotease [Sediminibacterium roseum]NCI51664.1 zinc-dependent metalloprotease [Sediminibacterium roseum]
MKKQLLILALMATTAGFAQRDTTNPAPAPVGGVPRGAGAFPGLGGAAAAGKPRPYKEVITDKAVTKKGLFTVHKVEDKYYFEIGDTLLSREILTVTRFSKVPGGGGQYGGEQVNEQSIRFERGPSNNLFVRVVALISTADSTTRIAKAVANSYLDPIAVAFPIAAYGKDSASYVFEVTDFFKSDNQLIALDAGAKRQFGLQALASDRSYIQSINTFPINTEIRTVKTYSASAGAPGGFPGTPGSSSLPAGRAAGAVTVELNTSMLLLPKLPMYRRLFDSRVGFFADRFTVYSDDQQKVDNQTFAVRWRLEPKAEDLQKYFRGELVEPAKQIIYYIDPATPKQWVKPLIDGINDWNVAFEKAGWKNAIVGKEWPNDPNMSLEDARYSVIRYFASDIENAYGPQVHDPRSGEILESHIGWYHNVMKLVHDWYMVQTAAVDPKARKMKFDDELMGQLIRFVSSHEVGHTLGLRHNMGSSSKTPVENLRNKAWVEANGHTASIMDYARFNYVAQPEDNISEKGLFPRIGDYDKWAIEWGYRFLGENDVEKDMKINNQWIIKNIGGNPRLWFGGEGRGNDPRAQTEDLGDNAVKASDYGIKNLKRVLANLPEWTKEEGDHYENLSDMYGQVIGQFGRYMGHVSRNVGGIYETFKSIEEPGDVYEPTPKAIQKDAVSFINKQLFATPTWLLDKNILNKIAQPATTERIQTLQVSTLRSLLDGTRLGRLTTSANRFGAGTYTADELVTDVQSEVFSELASRKPIDNYRRNLQKEFVEQLITLGNPPPPVTQQLAPGISITTGISKTTDVTSIAKGHLRSLQSEASAAAAASTDKMTKYHLQDIADRIKKALDPK